MACCIFTLAATERSMNEGFGRASRSVADTIQYRMSASCFTTPICSSISKSKWATPPMVCLPCKSIPRCSAKHVTSPPTAMGSRRDWTRNSPSMIAGIVFSRFPLSMHQSNCSSTF
ncbi:disease resistance protein [Striga asiatica]|uniref:Disease resistance protein n=1 Tax=Striga asiatica TaxID=4170 RepID=A0A5A7P3F6_STRAF|nr:disease resistance protein [Striga asiatica]